MCVLGKGYEKRESDFYPVQPCYLQREVGEDLIRTHWSAAMKGEGRAGQGETLCPEPSLCNMPFCI